MNTEFRYFVVLDFEATCCDKNPPDPQEVIEFPSVLVDAQKFKVIDEFESFVKPVHHPELSNFCRNLTAITQEHVETAPVFNDVYESHRNWLIKNNLKVDKDGPGEEFSFVLCGDWDLKTMLPNQLKVCSTPFETVPYHFRRWINIKRPFGKYSGIKSRAGMPLMLNKLELELEGHHHRGIDDCRNIAKILIALIKKGIRIETTTHISSSAFGPMNLTVVSGDITHHISVGKRKMATLKGMLSGIFRTQDLKITLEDGTELINDEDLFDLKQNQVIIVEK